MASSLELESPMAFGSSDLCHYALHYVTYYTVLHVANVIL